MYSVGIDLVEINRIQNSIKNSRFLERIFGVDELFELENRGFPIQSIAGAFAAKEAFSKAIGTGLSGLSFKEVQILHKKSGEPFLKLTGKALELSDKNKMEFSVSITHTNDLAQAIVLGYKNN